MEKGEARKIEIEKQRAIIAEKLRDHEKTRPKVNYSESLEFDKKQNKEVLRKRVGGRYADDEKFAASKKDFKEKSEEYTRKYNALVESDKKLYDEYSKMLNVGASKKKQPKPEQNKPEAKQPSPDKNEFLNECDTLMKKIRNTAVTCFTKADLSQEKSAKLTIISRSFERLGIQYSDLGDKLSDLAKRSKNSDDLESLYSGLGRIFSRFQILNIQEKGLNDKFTEEFKKYKEETNQPSEQEDDTENFEDELSELSDDDTSEIAQRIRNLEAQKLKLTKIKQKRAIKKRFDGKPSVLGKIGKGVESAFDLFGINASDELKLLGGIGKLAVSPFKAVAKGVSSVFSTSDKSVEKKLMETNQNLSSARFEKKHGYEPIPTTFKHERVAPDKPTPANVQTDNSVKNIFGAPKPSQDKSAPAEKYDLNRTDDVNPIVSEIKITNEILTKILKKESGLGASGKGSFSDKLKGFGNAAKGLGKLGWGALGAIGGAAFAGLAKLAPLLLTPTGAGALAVGASVASIATLVKQVKDLYEVNRVTTASKSSTISTLSERLREKGATNKDVRQYEYLIQKEQEARIENNQTELENVLKERNSLFEKYGLRESNKVSKEAIVTNVSEKTDTLSKNSAQTQIQSIKAEQQKTIKKIDKQETSNEKIWEDAKNFLKGEFVDALVLALAQVLNNTKGGKQFAPAMNPY